MMDLIVTRVDVWAASFGDQSDGLASILRDLRDAGADLNFVISRRSPEKPGTGVVFVTPLYGDTEIEAAKSLGFNVTKSVHSVRVEGKNRSGVVAELTTILSDADIDLQAVSASVYGPIFILYVGFDNAEDAIHAVDLLRSFEEAPESLEQIDM